MKLDAVILPASDVDGAKAFYEIWVFGWMVSLAAYEDGNRYFSRTAPRDGAASRLLRENTRQHNWWDWYAPFLNARQNGKTSEEAAAAANRYMEEVHHIPRR